MPSQKLGVVGWVVLVVLGLVALGSCSSCLSIASKSVGAAPRTQVTVTRTTTVPAPAAPAHTVLVTVEKVRTVVVTVSAPVLPASVAPASIAPATRPVPLNDAADGKTPQPLPPPAPVPATNVYYANCDAVRAAGAAPLHRGEPGYRTGLDGDHDGVACEPKKG